MQTTRRADGPGTFVKATAVTDTVAGMPSCVMMAAAEMSEAQPW